MAMPVKSGNAANAIVVVWYVIAHFTVQVQGTEYVFFRLVRVVLTRGVRSWD